jgi:uncharacterized membrane protein YGL010W
MDIKALVEDYERNHESIICKLTHLVGIPMIALSILMLPFRPRRALKWFAIGWTLQFAGHAAEGQMPKFFEGKEYLLAGLVWWTQAVAAPAKSLLRR